MRGPFGRALGRAGLTHRARRYARRVDPDEIRWMRSVLREGDLAVDVGAHKGGYTYWMRREVGRRGAVIAFEPQPKLTAYLKRCVADFGWGNVTVMGCALSSEPGRRELLIPGAEAPAEATSPGASLVGASLPAGSRGYPVDVDTLDRVLATQAPDARVRLLKCDVEGHELDVFSGARDTIERCRPLILFECEARHDPTRSVEDVFDHLRELRYRGSFFLRGQELPVDRLDLARHQVEGRRPYVNNFVFVPDGAMNPFGRFLDAQGFVVLDGGLATALEAEGRRARPGAVVGRPAGTRPGGDPWRPCRVSGGGGGLHHHGELSGEQGRVRRRGRRRGRGRAVSCACRSTSPRRRGMRSGLFRRTARAGSSPSWRRAPDHTGLCLPTARSTTAATAWTHGRWRRSTVRGWRLSRRRGRT